MNGWLLDTNVVSELRRVKCDPNVAQFIAAKPLATLFVSIVTLAKVRFGIAIPSDARRRSDLEAWLTHKVRPMFDGRVLPVSEDVMLKWRLLVEDGRKSRHTFSQPDLNIAATAACHGLTVITRDIRDYEKAGVPVQNPWT